MVAFPSSVNLEARVIEELKLCLVFPAPAVCIPINFTSLCNGFSTQSVSMQDYLPVSIYSPYLGGGFISNLADGEWSHHCE